MAPLTLGRLPAGTLSEFPPIHPPPCHDNRSNTRAAFYARGAHVFQRQARGLLPLKGEVPAEPRTLRLALVIPWVKTGSVRSSCETTSRSYEAKAFGAPCTAFGLATLPPSWPFWVASAAMNADVADFLLMHGLDYDPSEFYVRAGLLALPRNVRSILVPNMTALYQRRLRVRVELTDDKVKDFKCAMPCHVCSRAHAAMAAWSASASQTLRVLTSARCTRSAQTRDRPGLSALSAVVLALGVWRRRRGLRQAKPFSDAASARARRDHVSHGRPVLSDDEDGLGRPAQRLCQQQLDEDALQGECGVVADRARPEVR